MLILWSKFISFQDKVGSLGKGKVTTYWLIDATDKVCIDKKEQTSSKLKPLFRNPNMLGPGSATPALSGTGHFGSNTPEVIMSCTYVVARG